MHKKLLLRSVGRAGGMGVLAHCHSRAVGRGLRVDVARAQGQPLNLDGKGLNLDGKGLLGIGEDLQLDHLWHLVGGGEWKVDGGHDAQWVGRKASHGVGRGAVHTVVDLRGEEGWRRRARMG